MRNRSSPRALSGVDLHDSGMIRIGDKSREEKVVGPAIKKPRHKHLTLGNLALSLPIMHHADKESNMQVILWNDKQKECGKVT